VRCALSKSATMALEKWITSAGLKYTDYLFPGGARRGSRPISGRQLSRLLKVWIVDAGFDPADYSVESLRRTKALHILKGTGDLQTVRALLGHVQIESTARSWS
jgi:site-specific recombinase XerD